MLTRIHAINTHRASITCQSLCLTLRMGKETRYILRELTVHQVPKLQTRASPPIPFSLTHCRDDEQVLQLAAFPPSPLLRPSPDPHPLLSRQLSASSASLLCGPPQFFFCHTVRGAPLAHIYICHLQNFEHSMAPRCPHEKAQVPGLAFRAHADLSCSSRVGLAGDELWVVEPFITNHLLRL